MSLQRGLLYGFVLIIVLAPLPFGSVQEIASATLVVVCLLLGILWVLWRSRCGMSPLPWREPLLIAGLLLALLGVGQIIPLPRTILETVSPQAVELRDRFEPVETSVASDGSTDRHGFTGWRPISLYPWATRQATLRFVAFLVVALIALEFSASQSSRRVVLAALVASGGFQAIYGLAEYFSNRQHIFGYAKKYYTDVATGTFINRNHFAGYLEMTLPLAIALAAMSIAQLRSTRGSSVAERMERVTGRRMFNASLLMVLALTMATALVCSRSRMGIVSITLALLTIGLVLAWRGRGKAFAAAAVMVVGATLVIFSQGGAADPLIARFMSSFEGFGGSLGRWQIWSQVAVMAGAFPILGLGMGVFPYVFPAFRRTGEGFAVAHAHNDYLEMAAEVGVIGCALVLLGAVLVLRSVMRRNIDRHPANPLGYAALAGVLAIGFHSLTDFNLAIPSNALTLAVLIGVVVGWLRLPAPSLVPAREIGAAWAIRAVAPACLLVVFASLAGAPLLAAAGGVAVSARATPVQTLPGGVAKKEAGRGWVDFGNAERLFETAAAIGGKKFAYGKGCQTCNFTGHRGRMAITEVLHIDDRLRELILSGVSTSVLQEAAVETGMSTLQESGLAAIFAGDTSVEEVLREAGHT